MFSSFSNSYSLGYFKSVVAILANYIQMTYTITGSPNDAVLLNSPAIYPVDFVSGGIGKANGTIDDLNNTSFVNKNISLYFKSLATNDGFNYAATLFYFGTNPASANHKMLIMKNNSSGTSYKCVVGSNNVSYIDTTFATSGTDANFHTFIKISDTNELRIILYDSVNVSVFDSGIVTIDSSTFGNDFTVWSLNHDATNSNADTVRLTTTFEAGKWNKVISDTEMAYHLTLWSDYVDILGGVIFYTFEQVNVIDRSGNNYHPTITSEGVTMNNPWNGGSSFEPDGLVNTVSNTKCDVLHTIPIPNGLTISYWIYKKNEPAFPTGEKYRIFCDFAAGFFFGFQNNASTLYCRWGNIGTKATQFTVPVDNWFHFCFTITATNNANIYINNVLKATLTYSDTPLTQLSNFRISGERDGAVGGTCHNGYLDNFRLYDYVIDATKRNDLYNET